MELVEFRYSRYNMTMNHVTNYGRAICVIALMVNATVAFADSAMLIPADGGYNPGVVKAQRIDLPEQKSRPGAWITAMDYPADALREERGGTVIVELSVGSDGRVTGCRIVTSSKFAPLDARTCEVFRGRARYVAPRDSSGIPTQGLTVERVRWVIPN